MQSVVALQNGTAPAKFAGQLLHEELRTKVVAILKTVIAPPTGHRRAAFECADKHVRRAVIQINRVDVSFDNTTTCEPDVPLFGGPLISPWSATAGVKTASRRLNNARR